MIQVTKPSGKDYRIPITTLWEYRENGGPGAVGGCSIPYPQRIMKTISINSEARSSTQTQIDSAGITRLAANPTPRWAMAGVGIFYIKT